MHSTRIFKEDKDLLKAWNEYKENLSQEPNKWIKIQYVGKEGKRVTDSQKVPYTLEGFKRFCRINYGDITEYFLNREGYYDEFTTICRIIKEEIREDQIIGGLLGFYNPSITQRLNGLTEKIQQEKTNVVKFEFDGND
jgi:hypothetical protein